ncbi:MAG: class I SAM-dependent methyltransferase [Lachnospiraceae bacterium]
MSGSDSKEKLQQLLDRFLNEQLIQAVVSNPVEKGELLKVKVHPVLVKGTLHFQAEEWIGKQVFHKNLNTREAKDYLTGFLDGIFRQLEVQSVLGQGTVLISKKGTMTVKIKQAPAKIAGDQGLPVLSHNRKKHYVLEEGRPVPFLVDLGIMTAQGAVVHAKYDKFRQINRFLEFIEDILPKLDKTRESVIIDFGCGKSYLTFAMYYYLKELKGYPIRIIGLDLKKDVIARCNALSQKYGFEHLSFLHGDIASFEGEDHVDMVVTLHACDLATDYALEKAVRWGAKVILSVPCCQHELNRQMESELLEPVLQYGLIRERMAALYTDGLRAELLEYCGYRTQILEFIDMEHTPKNLLIRAVKQGTPKDNEKQIRQLMEFLHVEPTLAKLLLH